VSQNLFHRISVLLPDAPVYLGRVLAHHEDDTSTVELPIGLATVSVGGNAARGSLIRPRGRTVPIGGWAFVRRGVIETRAPTPAPNAVSVGAPVGPPGGASVWDEGSPLTVGGGASYSLTDAGRTMNIPGGSVGQRVETVSTPTQDADVRYFELSFTGPFDQCGFATGDICAAGGTLDFLTDPIGSLVNVQRNNNTGQHAIWLRKWTAGPTFEEEFILIDAIDEGARVGFLVDLDSGECTGITIDGTEIAPGPLTGADLTAWGNLANWAAGQSAAPQFLQRAVFGDTTLTLHTGDTISFLPGGATAWDTA
jgi:hypothetical protein